MTTNRTRARITADDTVVEVDPGLGGGIVGFRMGAVDVLRPAVGLPETPLGQSMFVMAPWTNRIAGGRFFFDDEFVSLSPNLDEEPHPIHGEAWQRPWEVADAGERRLVLRFEGGSAEWPWPYSVIHDLTVEPGRLDSRLTIVNDSDSPMPAGLGFHPYFERPARLTATVDGAWSTTGLGPLPTIWDDRDGFRSTDIDGIIADESYTGWDGRAVIESPAMRVDIVSNLDVLHLYSPRGQHFFCAEPCSAAPDAVNHERRGLRVLAPGASYTATMRMSAQPR